MKRHLALVFALLTSFLSAGTVTLPDFSTTWQRDSGPYQAHVETVNQWTVNLNDRSGLTPGVPIRITVTTGDQFLWTGAFHLTDGPMTIGSQASLGLILGGTSGVVTSSLFKDYGILTGYGNGIPDGGGPTFSDIAGYIFGPGLPALEIVVPWSADLTNAIFILSQVSNITGAGNGYSQSNLSLSAGQVASASTTFNVSFASIPEPATGLTLLLSALTLSLRRRRTGILE